MARRNKRSSNNVNISQLKKNEDLYKPIIKYSNIPASFMVALNVLIDYPINNENEMLIWQRSVNLPIRNCNIFALGILSKELSLQPVIYREDINYYYPEYKFKKYTKLDYNLAKKMNLILKSKADEKKVKIYVKELPFYIFSKIIKRNLGLVRLNLKYLWGHKNQSSLVLLSSIENGKRFVVYNPYKAGFEIKNKKEIQNAYNNLNLARRKHEFIIIKHKRGYVRQIKIPDPKLNVTEKDVNFFKRLFRSSQKAQ